MCEVHTCAAVSTHRRVREDMSSKMPVGRVVMSLFAITLRINWVHEQSTRARTGTGHEEIEHAVAPISITRINNIRGKGLCLVNLFRNPSLNTVYPRAQPHSAASVLVVL